MPHAVNCVILWHYYSADGKPINSSSTHQIGSMSNLNDRLRESYDGCKAAQAAGQPYTIAAQIIPSRI